MIPGEFELAIPARERPQTHALDHAVTEPTTISSLPYLQSSTNCMERNQFCEI
jgi:hypothetical protein